MRDRITCCKYCEGDERSSTCHSTCKRYKEERAELDEKIAKDKIKNQARQYMQHSVKDGKDRETKRRRKQKQYSNHSYHD